MSCTYNSVSRVDAAELFAEELNRFRVAKEELDRQGAEPVQDPVAELVSEVDDLEDEEKFLIGEIRRLGAELVRTRRNKKAAVELLCEYNRKHGL